MPVFRRRSSTDSCDDSHSSRLSDGSATSSGRGGAGKLGEIISFFPRRASQQDSAGGVRKSISRNFRPFQSCYQRSRICGVGSSAVVWVVSELATGHAYACKVIDRGEQAADNRANAAGPVPGHTELKILQQLGHHSDILGCREYFVEESRVYMIMELVDGTDLLSLVLERGSFPEEDAKSVFRKLLSALGHLHSLGIAHRDVKLENLVVSSSDDITSVKLIDFGLAGQVTSANPYLTARCGTPAYAAPEVLRRTPKYDTRCDLWSAGTALYTLLCGEPPFTANNLAELVVHIRKAAPSYNDPAWALVSPDAIDLVKGLLTADLDKRLSLRQALEHPWLKE